MSPLELHSVQRTTDAALYFRHPTEHWLERHKFCCASPGQRLYCLFAWGRLEAEDADELIEVLEACANTGARERLQLVVLRDVISIAATAMTRIMTYYSRRPTYFEGIAREAVVRPEGVVAMLAEGFHRVVPLPFPGRVFTRDPEALAWLSPGLVDLAGWTEAVREQWLASARVLGPELAMLEEVIRVHGAGLSLADAARSTGHSPRTLQRRLREAGTSFARERTRVLVTLAKTRLRESDADIKRIALELGFASPQRFTELFTREVGRAPASWRER